MTVALDLKREKEILVGRNWKLHEPLGPGEVYIASQFAKMLGVGVGDYVYGRFNVSFGGRAPFV